VTGGCGAVVTASSASAGARKKWSRAKCAEKASWAGTLGWADEGKQIKNKIWIWLGLRWLLGRIQVGPLRENRKGFAILFQLI
jgi:hypothetical protein